NLFCTTNGALTCTVSGLTAGMSYTFRVTATNSAGTSAPSAASNSVQAPTALLPGAFAIRMDGTPYTYRMPASVAAATERLTMSIVDLQGKRVWSRTVNPASDKITELTWNGRTTAGKQV